MRLPSSLHAICRPTVLFLLVGVVLSVGTAFLLRRQRQHRSYAEQMVAQRRLPDTLRAVTLSGATTFFTYRDEPMGYQYELVRLFASKHHLPLKVYVVHSLEDAERLVLQGKVDLCITPHAETHSARSTLRFAGPEILSGLILLQRKKQAGDTTAYLTQVTELLGKRITVLEGSRAEERLRRLEEQLGGKIDVQALQADTINSEDLIASVATREIDYTVADEELARLSKTYYPNLDLTLEVGFRQRLRWFTAPQAQGLANALDAWASELEVDKSFHQIYKRYFELNKAELPEAPRPATPTASPTPAEKTSQAPAPQGTLGISPFDKLFQQEAKRLGWPWQLLASIAWQESNFRPEVIGWSGARGLMGIMPRTGRIYGASKEQLLHPATSVRVSVDCLLATEALFRSQIPNLEERIKVTLAAYNAGPAHLQDAIRLAAKYGYSTTQWEGGIETTLRLKSEPKYYNDPVCRAGYVRGKGVARYVDEVVARYHGYLSKSGH